MCERERESSTHMVTKSPLLRARRIARGSCEIGRTSSASCNNRARLSGDSPSFCEWVCVEEGKGGGGGMNLLCMYM